jgi:hypothetical protein
MELVMSSMMPWSVCNILLYIVHSYDMLTLQLFLAWYICWAIAPRNQCINRKFWPSLHPVLMAEALFALATILAFGRILSFCQLHHKLGPLQVSLAKMTSDLAQCCILFVIVMISFSAGVYDVFLN